VSPHSSFFALAVLVLTLEQAEIVEKSLCGRLACRVSFVNDKFVGRSFESVTIFEKATASRRTVIVALGVSGIFVLRQRHDSIT
jgi:hypothetical protein